MRTSEARAHVDLGNEEITRLVRAAEHRQHALRRDAIDHTIDHDHALAAALRRGLFYPAEDPDVAQVGDAVRAFVDGGGRLFVGDWSYDLVELAWPDQIDWVGQDTIPDAAQLGEDDQVDATVSDDALEGHLDPPLRHGPLLRGAVDLHAGGDSVDRVVQQRRRACHVQHVRLGSQ